MDSLSIFNIVSGVASIISLGISIWALKMVYAVQKSVTSSATSTHSGRQVISGSGNVQAGGSVNASRQ